jgi:uncharacterized protein (DUF39 family)
MAQTHSVNKTIEEINARIRKGKAVVLNASEMTRLVREKGKVAAAKEVDVVTTGTFSPMCSSGLFFNFGQPEPPVIRANDVWLNDVHAYGGIAAADGFIGATQTRLDDPLNKVHPGKFPYGGGHVIEDLAAGKVVKFRARAYATDCYPREELERDITLKDLPFAQLVNPRNAYQNYNCALNMTSRTKYTYLGPLKPNMRNANYATSGELSPLFNDPYFKTIGLGSRIFLGGGVGYVLGAGTQHVPNPERNDRGIPLTASGTLMVKGDLKGMDPKWLRGSSILGYGCSLIVGLGIPIPVLNEDIAWYTGVGNSDIEMPVRDYGHDVPNAINNVLAQPTFEELRSGQITVKGEKVQSIPLTSWVLSLEIADTLKAWIENGDFLLTEPQEAIESR